jgi:hypothetical protein
MAISKLVNQRTTYTTLFYVLVVLLIIVSKPTFMFDEHTGDIRPFGVGEHKTIVSLGVMIVGLAIVSFYIFAVIDVMFAK